MHCKRQTTTVGEITSHDIPWISVAENALSVLTLLGENNAEFALVDDHVTIIDLTTQKDIATVLQVRQSEAGGVAPRVTM